MPGMERRFDTATQGATDPRDRARMVRVQAQRRTRVRVVCRPCRGRIMFLNAADVEHGEISERNAVLRAAVAGQGPPRTSALFTCPQCRHRYPVTWARLREEYDAARAAHRAVELPLLPGPTNGIDEPAVEG